jgi:hypothetical protein
MYGFYGRLAAAVVGMLVVYNFPKNGVDNTYLVIVMIATVLSSFMKYILVNIALYNLFPWEATLPRSLIQV